MEIRQAANFAIDFANQYTSLPGSLDRLIGLSVALKKFDDAFKLIMVDYVHSNPYKASESIIVLSCSGEAFDLSGKWGPEILLPENAISSNDQKQGVWTMSRMVEIENDDWHELLMHSAPCITQIEEMGERLFEVLQSYKQHDFLQQRTHKTRGRRSGSRL